MLSSSSIGLFVVNILLFVAIFAKGQKIVNLHVTSQIQSRFATTHVTSEILNTDNDDKEITFEAQLPADAFISNFTMKINGVLQVGEVKEKKQARKDYDRAKAGGHTAGLVEQKPRETDRFRTSVNVAAGGKVKFDLTYQEVLKRVHGVYKHVVNILSAEDIEDLKIDVYINEKGRIKDIHVPKFGPKIGEKTNKELLALQQNPDVSVRNTVDDGLAKALISYQPTNKTSGQLAVLYDLERSFNGGEVEVVDGHFVHFFSPQRDSLPKGATNIVFVLDRSGSMQGRKFTQLQEAMQTILSDLKAEDRFSIVWFSTEAEAWDESLREANGDNVKKALQFVKDGSATGGTNIHGALNKGLNILRDDKENSDNSSPRMILFLTDGLPTAGEIQGTDEILKSIGNRNKNLKVKIHNLAFGNDADYKMLQKMSSENDGLARKIYEASDAKFQLEGFYSEIANPIFTNLDIKYLNGAVNISSIVKNRADDTYYEGSEVMILGKLADPTTSSIRGEVKATGPRGTERIFRCGTGCFTTCCRGGGIVCPGWCRPWPCPIPFPTPSPQRIDPPALPAYTLRGIVERMWGYMTIKNLLKEAELEGDNAKAKEKKAEALRLSLHYNFVTELTSMVVVDKEAEVEAIADEPEEELEADPVFYGASGISSRIYTNGGHAYNSRGYGGSSKIMGMPGPVGRPAPAYPQMPLATATALPLTTMLTTQGYPQGHSTSQVPECNLNLMIIKDGRSNSNVTNAQVDELLQELQNVQPSLKGHVTVVEVQDNSEMPKTLREFVGYRRISSLPAQATGGKTFQEIVNALSNKADSKVLIMYGSASSDLSDRVLKALRYLKIRGIEILGYLPSVADDTVQQELDLLTTGTNGQFIGETMNHIARALSC